MVTPVRCIRIKPAFFLSNLQRNVFIGENSMACLHKFCYVHVGQKLAVKLES